LQLELFELKKNKKKQNENIAEIPIEELDLSVRAYNVLKKEGLHTLKAVIEFGINNIISLPNAGIKTVAEIIKAVYINKTVSESDIDTSEQNSSEFYRPKILEPLDTPIEEIGLPIEAYRFFKSNRIKTVRDVLEFCIYDVIYHRNVNLKNFNKILKAHPVTFSNIFKKLSLEV